ncbi:MAG: EAL domain-containing protein [Gammaproteobacteria bacterium]|nr:EAL domain-containing protein [Gammaproteobacteria bacterium]MBV9697126.1 EAL domain-containing protein [Gammaproteobacteria bacterium]
MTEATPVPLIILSSTRDAVEAINSTLRRAGQPVHCTWLPALRDLGDALTQLTPEMLIQSAPMPDELEAAVRLRDKLAPGVPLLVLAPSLDEAQMADAMGRSAQDVVTLAQPARLQAVVLRELQAFRTARTLDATLKTANVARSQLESVLARSNDAIAQVQEGIIVEANPAWHELYGVVEGIDGTPVMDLFEESTHAALRGALAACQQGRWSDHVLRANAVLSDGSVLPLEITLALGEHDGESCVRLVVPSRPREQLAVAATALSARTEPGGLLGRAELLRGIGERLAKPSPGGMRCVALLRIDKFAVLERELGAVASEEVVIEVARLLKESLHPKELVGSFGGVRFLALLERGNEQDITAWSERLLSRIARHTMRIGEKTVSVTCTLGLSVVAPGEPQLEAVLADAIDSARKGAARGGNQSIGSSRADNDSRVMSYDAVWVKHIKAALMANRFRLVQQPIASLQGDDPGMFDVLVRMIDPQNREVLPSEFMAAAARNDLLKNIDRWVVGASLSYAAQKQPECLFVRLSPDTARDGGFLAWLDNHLRTSRAEPRRLCFQVTEESASNHISAVKELAAALRERKFRFALERFGSGRNSSGMLEAVPLDFVKIDGTLVQGLTGDEQLQQRVRLLAEAARKARIQTIAERVEDANTMAVLWQIGVQYIQGYFVNQPEAVVLSAR